VLRWYRHLTKNIYRGWQVLTRCSNVNTSVELTFSDFGPPVYMWKYRWLTHLVRCPAHDERRNDQCRHTQRLDLGPAVESSSDHAGLSHVKVTADVVVSAICRKQHESHHVSQYLLLLLYGLCLTNTEDMYSISPAYGCYNVVVHNNWTLVAS